MEPSQDGDRPHRHDRNLEAILPGGEFQPDHKDMRKGAWPSRPRTCLRQNRNAGSDLLHLGLALPEAELAAYLDEFRGVRAAFQFEEAAIHVRGHPRLLQQVPSFALTPPTMGATNSIKTPS
jgi:hypothetical protein